MVYLLSLIAIGVPLILGAYLAFAPKVRLRIAAARIPRVFLGDLPPDSKKEAVVFGFWRVFGALLLAFSVFIIFQLISHA
ncbi:MAG: hypothetical protein SynsKO_45800 [Synoicihabitans sp.]